MGQKIVVSDVNYDYTLVLKIKQCLALRSEVITRKEKIELMING